MSELINVKGLSDLQKFMDELTPKMEANVMRGALRAGMSEVLPVARSNIHSVSGELANGLKLTTKIKRGVVIAAITAKGVHGFVARWVEFGTAAHKISAKAAKVLSIGGFFTKSVQHPGAKAHPFMRPALDQQASAATIAAGNYIKNRLATKNGLDTSSITVGDES